jgi:hypothetical protein
MTCDILQTTIGRDELNMLTRMEHDNISGDSLWMHSEVDLFLC